MKMLKTLFQLAAAACVSLVSLHTMAADLAEIKERGVLRHIGIQYANFVTRDGQGLDAELMRGFARHIGVRYELVQSNFYDAIRDLLGKDVVRKGDRVTLEGNYPVRGDLIAAGFTVLPWRQAVLDYSAPVFPSQVLLVARTESPYRPIAPQASLRDEIAQTRALLGTKSLLVMERTCLDPANYGLTDVGIDLRRHTASLSLDDMVPSLLKGAAEFTLLDVPDAILDMNRWSGRIRLIGPISEYQDLAVAFPKTSPVLRAAFNDYLKLVRADGTYDKLVNKYYPGIRSFFPEFFTRNR